jgi:lysophospholipase L1-like esterase
MKGQIRILVLCNIVTLAILTTLLIKDNYPQRIWVRLDNFVHNRPQVKPHHFSDNLSYEQQTGLYRHYQSPKNIVMLGNSITSRVNWCEFLNRSDITNMGIDGDITEGYLNRLLFVRKLNPKICFIEGGINDLFYTISQDTTLHNLREIVAELKSYGIVPVLTTIPFVTINFSDAKNLNNKIREINTELAKLATTEKISLIDLNRLLSDANFRHTAYAISDGLHLTDKAYVLWCEEILKILEQEKI